MYDAIRNEVKDDYPVWIKINSGLSFEESSWVCRELDQRGINAIEVSGGISVSRESASTRIVPNQNEKGRFSGYALSLENNVNATVISVGGYRTPEMIEQWLNKGEVEVISLCRPLICEPDLPYAWKSGDRRSSRYVSCNKCFDYSSGFGCKVFK